MSQRGESIIRVFVARELANASRRMLLRIASAIMSVQKDSHLFALIMHGQVLMLKVYLSLHLPYLAREKLSDFHVAFYGPPLIAIRPIKSTYIA